ncbi:MULTISPECIES: sulfite exporter TauE/SafE family protein [unclassified Streptomyces]|uniref:sulfite exporter TauE/SafE family protein n=1 Tax=unclassified Streptomyces TaxID=2593676 RepID=UPI000DAD757B|nr:MULTISPECIES: sulfite exporter TauE/SafE family protein [unclassified Streptomyces]PZT71738.1 sulfite exporter TauE/SafE family protein [Streptomyces sp. AC1-42T]PZT73136.1 sulfite exporter TauE/SafE family protein [Streptomyces sp. AC1-42W]
MTALILALVAGTVVGLALGGLGGGGSVLAVPALTYLIGMPAADAITASLIIVTVTSLTSLAGHARDGNVAWRTGLLFASAGIVPAMLAGLAAGHLPQALLTFAFAGIAGLAALRMLRPAAAPATGEVRPAKAGAAGAGLGAVTGLLGVGGGFLAVPALVRVLNLPMRRAIGTSLLVITVNSIAALGARAGSGMHLDWAVIAPFTAAAILGAWDGKRYAQRLSGSTLRRLFAWALLAVAAFMLADALF